MHSTQSERETIDTSMHGCNEGALAEVRMNGGTKIIPGYSTVWLSPNAIEGLY